MDAYEIVHVINATHLIDSESYQRAFEVAQAGRLQPGFYVVIWCGQPAALRYDGRADYVGPFASRHQAEEAQTSIASGAAVAGRPPIEVSLPA
jgi:hypothetical protein